MRMRRLGANGPAVGEIGLGCMSFAGAYGNAAPGEAEAVLDAAREHGITHLDTAKIYGDGQSEEILGKYLKSHPHKFTLATKGGILTQPQRGIDNSAAYLRDCLEGSLRRLGVEHVGLYYVHRRDVTIPIEEVTGTLSRFVEEGKIGGIGYSEISPASLRRANAVHRVMAVQSEYSLWSRQPELGMLAACEELGTAFVAFSPLARGLFANVIPDPEQFSPGDFRRHNPRFQPDTFPQNAIYARHFAELARDMGHTSSALAIAWVLHRSPAIHAIPGTRSAAHLIEDIKAAAITLDAEAMAAIEAVLPAGFAHGARYSAQQFVGVEIYG